MVDLLYKGKTRVRREYCSFYTESNPILTYMVNKLDVKSGDDILEPCAGDGVFIDNILESTPFDDYQIEAVDLNPSAVEKLRGKYSDYKNIIIKQTDTLLDLTFDLIGNAGGKYSKIIGNPPYGAWQDIDKRELLKKRYDGYVNETYTLFIKRCLGLLRNNGRLVFIVPDTFLALHLHKDIRKTILENSKVEEILLFPSKYFPGVRFGYSNLCIISLIKTNHINDNRISIVSVNKSINDLYEISNGNYKVAEYHEHIPQSNILRSIDYSFFLGSDKNAREIINNSNVRLGAIADCVTGICTGDNKKYLRAKNASIKGAKNHHIVDDELVDCNYSKEKEILTGLRNGNKYIPILKGGKGRFVKESEWYILWDEKAVKELKNNKDSRFQNSSFYFKEGIGVPMVKGDKINAFRLEKRLFDQSVVGIFPKEKKYYNYLLAYLNSDVCNKLLKIINHTANNSANYLKKLPIIIDEKALFAIEVLFDQYKKTNNVEAMIENINKIFSGLYSKI